MNNNKGGAMMYSTDDDEETYTVSRYDGPHESHEDVLGRHEAIRAAATRSPKWPGQAYISGPMRVRVSASEHPRLSRWEDSFDHYEVPEGVEPLAWIGSINEPDLEYEALVAAERRILYPYFSAKDQL